MANYRLNEEKHGVEIIFDAKPAEEIRNKMKAAGFRWGKGYWYAKQTAERLALAEELTSGNKTENAPKAEHKPQEKKNKYGIKVGDVFGMSWGYDQTNNDFFQVVELVGESSVRVREINPRIISRHSNGSMLQTKSCRRPRSVSLSRTMKREISNEYRLRTGQKKSALISRWAMIGQPIASREPRAFMRAGTTKLQAAM